MDAKAVASGDEVAGCFDGRASVLESGIGHSNK